MKPGLSLFYANLLLLPRPRLGSEIFEPPRHQLVLAARLRGLAQIRPLPPILHLDVAFIALHYVLKRELRLRLLHGHHGGWLCRALPLRGKLMRLELSLAHVAIVGCLRHLLIGSRLQVKQVVRGGRPRHIGTQAEGGLGKLRGGLDRLRVVGV